MERLRSLHIKHFVLSNIPQPVSVGKLITASGWGSGLDLEIRCVFSTSTPRWIEGWLWLQEEEPRRFDIIDVWYKQRRY